MTLNFNDFDKQDIKFDINELQKAYKEILKIKNFDSPKEISNFGAISLTQIPGDPDSIKGHKARGVYWTKPDSTGKETIRDVTIDETAYSEFIKDFKNTYFKEVYDDLSSSKLDNNIIDQLFDLYSNDFGLINEKQYSY